VLRTCGTALRIPWTPRFSDRGSNGKAIRLGSRVERPYRGPGLSNTRPVLGARARLDRPPPFASRWHMRIPAMAKDKEPVEILTASAEQTAEQITKQTQNYFGWLQKTMSVPWSNTNLNRILLNEATQSVTATFAFVQKLSQAKNFQDIVKIQTEFMATQMKSFNEQAKILGEIYSKAAEDAMKTPLGRT